MLGRFCSLLNENASVTSLEILEFHGLLPEKVIPMTWGSKGLGGGGQSYHVTCSCQVSGGLKAQVGSFIEYL